MRGALARGTPRLSSASSPLRRSLSSGARHRAAGQPSCCMAPRSRRGDVCLALRMMKRSARWAALVGYSARRRRWNRRCHCCARRSQRTASPSAKLTRPPGVCGCGWNGVQSQARFCARAHYFIRSGSQTSYVCTQHDSAKLYECARHDSANFVCVHSARHSARQQSSVRARSSHLGIL